MSKKYNILLTSMGGYGAINFIESFKHKTELNLNFIGTHCNKYFLTRSSFKKNYLLPSALNNKDKYIKATLNLIRKEKIDLIIPKSDIEVRVLGEIREKLKCNIFLPDQREIEKLQDKLDFYNVMKIINIPVPLTFHIKNIRSLKVLLSKINKIDNKYWLRIKTSGLQGAYGASWVRNENEAISWINRCTRHNFVKVNDFIISEYLPGRLFECLVLFNNGKLELAKVYENLIKIESEDPGNFGVGSSPELACSVNDKLAYKALQFSIGAINLSAQHLNTAPNGIYHMSAKVNINGIPCLTEVNIGRPPSTINIFNQIGKYNVTDYFINFALGLNKSPPKQTIDKEIKKFFVVRSFDSFPKIISLNDLKKIVEIK